MRLPVVIADDRDGVGVLRIVLLVEGEEPSGLGLDTEHIEHTAGSQFSPGALDMAPSPGPTLKGPNFTESLERTQYSHPL